jgi:hypothetical protein
MPCLTIPYLTLPTQVGSDIRQVLHAMQMWRAKSQVMAYGELKNGMRRIEKDKVLLKSPHPSPHVPSSLSDPSSSTISVPHSPPTIRILGSDNSSSLHLPRPVLICPVLVPVLSCACPVLTLTLTLLT